MLQRYLAPLLLLLSVVPLRAVAAQRVATIEEVAASDALGLLAARPSGKTVAMDRLGRLFALSEIARPDGLTEVRLHRSDDGGRSFRPESTLRVRGALRGSLVLDPDGATLHVVWGKHLPGDPYQVGYSRYDTRFRTWIGRDELLFPGVPDGDQYYWPDVDVDAQGRPVVVCSGGRTLGWRATMRYRDGTTWTAPRRVNFEETGVYPSVAVDSRGRFHFSYRMLPWLSSAHIAYRRFDPRTSAFGPEVRISDDSSNSSALALDEAGTPHVLFAKRGALMLASASAADATEGFQVREVTTDAVYSSQNVGYDYFALAIVDGSPTCYYANAERGQRTLYRRTLADGRLSDPVALHTAPDGVIESIGTVRGATCTIQELVTWVERDQQEGARTHRARTVWTGTVAFGRGCPDSAQRVASLTRGPLPGSSDPGPFTLRVDGARPDSTVLLLLGSSDALVAGSPLPLDLTYAGMPGCVLYQNALELQMSETDAFGSCTLPLLVPFDIAEARILLQAAVLDPEVNVGGLVTTAGLTLLVDR